MTMPQHERYKYRIVLETEVIRDIITLLRENLTPPRKGVINYLEKVIINASSGTRQPAFTLSDRPMSLKSKLGFDEAQKPAIVHHADEKLYNMWRLHPERLSVLQIEEVQEYRYYKDLMTPAEEEAYEIANNFNF